MRHKYIFAIAAAIAGAAGAGGLVWAMNAGEPAQESGPNEMITRFSGRDVARWRPVTVGDGMACRVSPAITTAGNELNHHRVVVDYTGPGTVKVSVAHSGGGDRRKTLTSRHIKSSCGSYRRTFHLCVYRLGFIVHPLMFDITRTPLTHTHSD